MPKNKKIIISIICLCLFLILDGTLVQASGTAPGVWDLVRQSVQNQSQPAIPKSQKLTITGQVVDYMARPVEDAEIAIIHREHYNEVLAPFVKTDKDGRFEVQANESSKYVHIVARKKGLAYAWDCLSYTGKVQDKIEYLLVLEKTNTLTGKVVNFNGKPVSGVSVQAIPKTSYLKRLEQRQIFGPEEWFTTKTDSNGIFSFDYFSQDVSSDFYVKAPEWNCTYKYTPHYQSSYGFEVWRSDIELVLPQEGEVKGRVTEEGTNRPVGGVELLIKTDRGLYFPITVTSASDGSFICEGLSEGKHIIELVTKETEIADWAAEQVEVYVSLEEPTEDVEVKVQKGGIIEYTVRQYNTEKLLPEADIETKEGSYKTNTITNEQGIARLRVLPGEYRVRSVADGYVQINDLVTVKDGEVTHVDIELAKSPTISGTVVDAAGRPAQDILVTLYPFGDHVYTDKEGRFEAGYDESIIGNGIYIIARDTQHSLSAFLYTMDLEKPVNLTLSPALTVKGKIVDPDGNGIPTARIALSILLPPTASRSGMPTISPLGAETLTDAQGMFEFKAIPLKQEDFRFMHSLDAAGFRSKEPVLIAIDGQPGTTVDVGTIQLESANLSVSGTVVDADGTLQPHCKITLAGVGWPKYTSTDKQGRFEVRGLSEGAIRIQANFDTHGSGSTRAHSGDQNVKVVLGQELVHTQHKSLKDTSLPDIVEFNLNPELIENKMLLICFWDRNQRPSRNYITQLNTKAQELKAKDVEIIAVQASIIDQDTLDGWVKEHNISFPVGMISENEEQTRFDWGVQSLPWLILTDAEHVVQAEGFALSELDNKITEIVN